MRVAWLGPVPREDQGVPAVATLIIRALAAERIELDCYTVAREEELPESLRSVIGVRWKLRETTWRPDRWYSRLPTTAYLTLRATRTANELRLGHALLERHRANEYDLVYQFSAPDTFGLGRHLRELPPLVLHPQVHAAGELRWHRHEEALAAVREGPVRRLAVRTMLAMRSRSQRRAVHRATRVICPSDRFAQLVAGDYGLSSQMMRVVPNPIDLERFLPGDVSRASSEPIRLLFVSMLSVRKGVEMVAALCHRLADLRGQVTIELAGEPREWSDYSGLLQRLDPEIGKPLGWVEPERLRLLYREVDGLLQPSQYEPFGIAVGEALASGVPVIASDAVGAAEWVTPPACRTFRAGDVDSFEAAVRALISELAEDGEHLKAAARSAAEAFDPASVGRRLATVLAAAAGRTLATAPE